MAAADFRVMTDATGQTLGKDASLQDIKEAILALPNATQEAADNANAAAAAATSAVSQLGGLIAETYSSSKTYSMGEYCYHNGKLYRCVAEISTAEEWTDVHWKNVALGNEVDDFRKEVNLLPMNVFDVENAVLGAYCNASGVITNNEKLAYFKIHVKKGDILYFRNFDYETLGQTFCCVFNASDTFKSRLTYPHADGHVSIDVPDADYVLVNNSIIYMPEFMVFKNEVYSGDVFLPYGVHARKEPLFTAGDDLEVISNKNLMSYRNIILHCDFIDNANISADGVIHTSGVSVASYRIYKIPVKVNDVIYISGKFDSGVNLPLFVTMNAGDFVKSYDDQPTNQIRIYTDRIFVVPSGVTEIYVNMTKNYADVYAAKVLIMNNRLIDRKWTIIGDSISVSKGHAHQLYHDLISVASGVVTGNLASAGMGYKHGSNPFYNQALSVPTDADIVTIMGSINDSTETLGTKDDTGTDTVGGCINKTITNIYSKCQTAKIGLITPTPTYDNMPFDDNCFLAKLSNLIIEVAKKRGIPYLDLFHCSNLRPNSTDFRAVCFKDDTGGADDNTHPNTEGHRMFYQRISSFIEGL